MAEHGTRVLKSVSRTFTLRARRGICRRPPPPFQAARGFKGFKFGPPSEY